MFVRSDGRGGFESLFPRVPKEYGPDGDRSLKVLSEEPYIARTQGTRTFPWRLAVVAGEDADLIENELVWLLAAPAADTDWEWVKPGLVSWDWWNGMRLSGSISVPGAIRSPTVTTLTSQPNTASLILSWTKAGRHRRPTYSVPIPTSTCPA